MFKNKKFLLVVLLSIVCLHAYNQSTDSSDVETPEQAPPIRMGIPGSIYSFIPPAHFAQIHQNDVFGFIHTGAMSSIQVKIVKGIPYTMLALSVTEESLAEQGARLMTTEEIDTKQGKPSIMFLVSYSLETEDKETPLQFERLMLMTGTYNETIWIDANYPAQIRPLLFNVMLESMLSVEF
jgi:hypothetical protein